MYVRAGFSRRRFGVMKLSRAAERCKGGLWQHFVGWGECWRWTWLLVVVPVRGAIVRPPPTPLAAGRRRRRARLQLLPRTGAAFDPLPLRQTRRNPARRRRTPCPPALNLILIFFTTKATEGGRFSVSSRTSWLRGSNPGWFFAVSRHWKTERQDFTGVGKS